MGLLDRLPGEGRRGVTVAVATGVVALMAAGLLAWLTWGRDGDPSAAVPPPVSAPAAVTVVSRGGGFSLTVPGDLTGTRLGRNVRVATADQTLLVTVGPGPRTSVARAQRSALAAIRDTYGKVRVADSVSTRLGGLPARRAVGTLVRKDGGPLVFSVTTGAQGRRTWSVIMFATRDVTADDLDRWYQPVLDGFRLT